MAKARLTLFCVDIEPARGCGVSDCPTYTLSEVIEIDSRIADLLKENSIVRIGLEVTDGR